MEIIIDEPQIKEAILCYLITKGYPFGDGVYSPNDIKMVVSQVDYRVSAEIEVKDK
jgi:hypothetical protein